MAATDKEILTLWMEMAGGLTQQQAAEVLGMSQPGINAVLTGKQRLSKVGRQFVRYLLRDGERFAPPPLPEEWEQTLLRIVDEMRERREALAAKYLSPAAAC